MVVTGADTKLGQAVLRAFLALAEELGQPLDLRAVPTLDAVPDLRRLGAVLEGAHTAVHLDRPLATWDILLEAAEDTGLVRIVTVLPPGAGAPAAPYEIAVVRADPGTPPERVAAAVVAADRANKVPPGSG